MNKTPLGGHNLEMPDPPALRVFAVFNAGDPCTDHQVSYTGQVPVTGVLRCSLCGTKWDPETGLLLPERKRS